MMSLKSCRMVRGYGKEKRVRVERWQGKEGWGNKKKIEEEDAWERLGMCGGGGESMGKGLWRGWRGIGRNKWGGGRAEDRLEWEGEEAGLRTGAWERAEKGRVRVRAGEGAVGQMEVLINKAIHYPGDSGRISTGKAANFYITKLIPIKKIYMCSQETSWLERRVHGTHICRKIILLHKY